MVRGRRNSGSAEGGVPFVPVKLAMFLGFARTSKSIAFSNQGI